MSKLVVIIPYRDRFGHLSALLPELKYCLSDINHEIIIVEQDDNELFNRGALKNIGALYATDADYFCFHDVDMVPDRIESDYSFGHGAIHLAARVTQFDYKVPYENYFGGVLLITKDDFMLVNGYSNNFKGWGAEDDDLFNRCKKNSINISRRDCKFISFDHHRDTTHHGKNLDYCLYCKNIPIMYGRDGLSNISYKTLNAFNAGLNGINFTLIQTTF